MKCLVVGLGVQGRKRRHVAGDDYVGCVDPFNAEADFKSIEQVPLDYYDAAMVCTPDSPKFGLLRYLLANGKHVLVEKPLWAAGPEQLERLESLARSTGTVCYTAYNHRFEPHFVRMRDLIASGELGRLYRCRLFYGNGTARQVRDSPWRDEGAGVWPDLGSHLLDVCQYWFDTAGEDFTLVAADRFENRSPDHVVVAARDGRPSIELEMSLVSWRNDFTCDILAENGSAHIRSLCKWGPAEFSRRWRVLPSGRPREEVTTLITGDPTWRREYDHFKALCAEPAPCSLAKDIWLYRTMRRVEEQIMAATSHRGS